MGDMEDQGGVAATPKGPTLTRSWTVLFTRSRSQRRSKGVPKTVKTGPNGEDLGQEENLTASMGLEKSFNDAVDEGLETVEVKETVYSFVLKKHFKILKEWRMIVFR